MSSPPAESQRRALWDAMLDADMNVCYWTFVCARYGKIDKVCRAVVAVSSSGTVAAWGFWSEYPLIWKGFSAIACLVSVIYPIVWPPDQIKKMSSLLGSWKQIATNYQLLWDRDSELTAPGSWKAFEKARNDQGKIDESRLPFSKKLRSKATVDVRRKWGLDSNNGGLNVRRAKTQR